MTLNGTSRSAIAWPAANWAALSIKPGHRDAAACGITSQTFSLLRFVRPEDIKQQKCWNCVTIVDQNRQFLKFSPVPPNNPDKWPTTGIPNAPHTNLSRGCIREAGTGIISNAEYCQDDLICGVYVRLTRIPTSWSYPNITEVCKPINARMKCTIKYRTDYSPNSEMFQLLFPATEHQFYTGFLAKGPHGDQLIDVL
ncbi:hypothetical protein RvY_16673 [Ramazzottius varieornatus]|uniref:Uncharacterized protein n=1 Tax=Ramazzottius varieornatus TaxID=947166 RepID=A0A1D1W1Z5_RAMVA|nr:hypothetical protein RvY_16673 [Ramazzottius varieornatus]